MSIVRFDHFSKQQWKELPFPYPGESIAYASSGYRPDVDRLEYKDNDWILCRYMAVAHREGLEKQ